MDNKEFINVVIKRCVGDLIKYERDNEGLRERLDEPYRKMWTNAKFTLSSGKKKCEVFRYEDTEEEILSALNKKYSNLKTRFIIIAPTEDKG